MAKKLRNKAKDRTEKRYVVEVHFSGVSISLMKRDALELADMLEGKA